MTADLTYLLRFDDEVLPIDANMTVGRHIDCDVIVAGEDVLDFHVRLESDERGPIVHPLQDATFSVNGVERNVMYGIGVGDTLGVGSMTLQIGVEREIAAEAEEWWLYEAENDEPHRIDSELLVGRQGDCDLVVVNDHISRHHARLKVLSGAVWVSDLDSANGTTVNGFPVVGTRRLLHGDRVAFDEVVFQLVGRGGELTGVRKPSREDLEPLREVPLDESLSESKDNPSATADVTQVLSKRTIKHAGHQPAGNGIYMLGVSEPVNGQSFQLTMGRTLIGRDSQAGIRLKDASVSTRHAELTVRPEGITLTDLMSTNGTLVNDERVHVAHLKDGDHLTFGSIQLALHAEDCARTTSTRWRVWWPWLLGGAVLSFAALFLLLS